VDSGELQVRLSLLLGQVLRQLVKEVERIEVVTTIHTVEVEARETVTTLSLATHSTWCFF